MANIVYIAASLDGYIARPDGGIDWLMDIPNPGNSDYGFADFIKRIDGIVMGRNTFETALGFSSWPYERPTFVLSNTLKAVPARLEGKAEIVSGELPVIVQNLAKRGINNLYIDGGKTIQSFLQANLIDEMIVTTVSKIIGAGLPLFGSTGVERGFRLIGSEILSDYLVKNHYVRL